MLAPDEHNDENTAAPAEAPSRWRSMWIDLCDGFRENPIRSILVCTFGIVFFGVVVVWTAFLFAAMVYGAWTEIPENPHVSAIAAFVGGAAVGYYLFRSPADKMRDQGRPYRS
jgi:hypothetical protein